MSIIPESFTAIDFETASGARASACALGIVVVRNGKITDEKAWLINPECEFSSFNIQVHGITPHMVKKAPSFPNIWDEVKCYLDNATVCAHNLSFDNSVLQKTLHRYALSPVPFESFCTVAESRLRLKHLPHHRLNNVAEALSLGEFDHHDALADARMCAMVALKLRTMERGI